MKCIYKIIYSGNGRGDPSKTIALKVWRSKDAKMPLVAFFLNCYTETMDWKCGMSGPIVFPGEELPVVEATGEGIDWQIVCTDPDDKYKSMKVWGRNGVPMEPVPYCAPRTLEPDVKP